MFESVNTMPSDNTPICPAESIVMTGFLRSRESPCSTQDVFATLLALLFALLQLLVAMSALSQLNARSGPVEDGKAGGLKRTGWHLAHPDPLYVLQFSASAVPAFRSHQHGVDLFRTLCDPRSVDDVLLHLLLLDPQTLVGSLTFGECVPVRKISY